MLTMSPTEIDAALGQLLRLHRKSAGLSQQELALGAGISFQQIQKYETGQNRLSISRLFVLADTIGVEPARLISELQKTLDLHEGNNVDRAVHFLGTKQGRDMINALLSMKDYTVLNTAAKFLAEASQFVELKEQEALLAETAPAIEVTKLAKS